MADSARRPRAWSVLAVSLALMALVAAISSTSKHKSAEAEAVRARSGAGSSLVSAGPPRGGGQPADGSASHAHLAEGTGTPRGTPRAPSTRDGGQPGSGPRTGDLAGAVGTLASVGLSTVLAGTGLLPPVAQLPAPGAGTGGTGSALDSASRSTIPAADTGPSTATGSAVPSATGTAPSPALSPYPGHGSLSSLASSASFAAAGGGTVSAEVAWSGTPSLQLTIACPGGVDVDRAGASPLSALVDDAPGAGSSCTVTVQEPGGVAADVNYTLRIEPAP